MGEMSMTVMPVLMPYDVPHPSVFILEEMAARGWNRDLLAWLLVLNAANFKEALAALDSRSYAKLTPDWQIERLALDLYFDVGPSEPSMVMGDTAAKFARVFGTSERFFYNLEESWQRSVQPASDPAVPNPTENPT